MELHQNSHQPNGLTAAAKMPQIIRYVQNRTFFWTFKPRLQTGLSGMSYITRLGKLQCHSNPCVFFIIDITS